ncbi:hypothetical protein [Burkholderia contaminans]|uniref:hypothetical protein n=1 Tax=Burkholderia contaminans TaxID=488447 RepID=UPI00158DB68B|nr:hypothetical protein [Burkholderia contaminans]
MHEAEMRAVLIYGEANENLLSQISTTLPTWKLSLLDPARHPIDGRTQVLRKGPVEIHLHEIAPNVLRTVNVLPHDANRDQDAANRALKDLADELDAAGFRCEVTASDKDLT